MIQGYYHQTELIGWWTLYLVTTVITISGHQTQLCWRAVMLVVVSASLQTSVYRTSARVSSMHSVVMDCYYAVLLLQSLNLVHLAVTGMYRVDQKTSQNMALNYKTR